MPTVRRQTPVFPMKSDNVQILNYNGHWGCVSTIGCDDGKYPSPSPVHIKQIRARPCTQGWGGGGGGGGGEDNFETMSVQQQTNTTDSGLYAIANAHALCSGSDPCKTLWIDTIIPSHLATAVERNSASFHPLQSQE